MTNSQLVNLFLDLVRIDSPSGNEALITDFICQKLRTLSLSPEIDSAGNLYVRVPGIGSSVILSAHLDTVEPGRGVKPIIDSGVIKSSGDTILGADNKVALAAILQALFESYPSKNRSLELVFSVREETDSGISHFDFSRLQSRTGLIPDRSAPLGSLVIASPWITNLEIEIIGRSAHASVPETATNALTVAAAALNKTKWGRLNPVTTSNIGLIKGGTAMNTVPGSILLTGEVRSYSQKYLGSTLLKLENKFKQVTRTYNAQLNFKTQTYCRGYDLNPEEPVVIQLSDLIKSRQFPVRLDKIYGASDSNVFIAHGIKVLTISDGCKNPHTVDENISVSDLSSLKNLILAYISTT